MSPQSSSQSDAILERVTLFPRRSALFREISAKLEKIPSLPLGFYGSRAPLIEVKVCVWFWSEKRAYSSDYLVWDCFFILIWLGIGYFVYREHFFLHQHWQICSSRMFTKEAASGHILEACINLRRLKWGISFFAQIRKSLWKSQILI